MVYIDGQKYACERCIRGHRVTGCTHTNMPLKKIKPKGRPTTQCQHCKDRRKNSNLHSKCLCGSSAPGSHTEACPCFISKELCTCHHKKKKPTAAAAAAKQKHPVVSSTASSSDGFDLDAALTDSVPSQPQHHLVQQPHLQADTQNLSPAQVQHLVATRSTQPHQQISHSHQALRQQQFQQQSKRQAGEIYVNVSDSSVLDDFTLLSPDDNYELLSTPNASGALLEHMDPDVNSPGSLATPGSTGSNSGMGGAISNESIGLFQTPHKDEILLSKTQIQHSLLHHPLLPILTANRPPHKDMDFGKLKSGPDSDLQVRDLYNNPFEEQQ